jgi:hypothetical protein
MSKLLSLPDDQIYSIFQYLRAADLWRLGAVCRTFHGKDLDENAVYKKFKARDDFLLLSQQYPRESPVLSLFDCRQRVLSFERCSEFAQAMSLHVKKTEEWGYSCSHYCRCAELHGKVPKLANGLRDSNCYLFFVQFMHQDKILWEGFIRDYNPKSDLIIPIDDLLRKQDGSLTKVSDVFGMSGGLEWLGFQSVFDDSDVQFHLDTSNVTNFTRDHVNSDLFVTLVSLICSTKRGSTARSTTTLLVRCIRGATDFV